MGQQNKPSLLDDLPPSYDQAVASSQDDIPDLPAPQSGQNYTDNFPLPSDNDYSIPGGRPSYRAIGRKETGFVTLDPTLAEDGQSLSNIITRQARIPPRPCLAVRGVHSETRSNGKDNKTESVVDFDFQVDLTSTLLRWDHPELGSRWYDVLVVADGDGQKAYRGGRCRSRQWREERESRRRVPYIGDEEGRGLVESEDGEPGLRSWCERFARDPGPVKSFTFKRTVSGFDSSALGSSLTSQLRSLNYRGNICISLAVNEASITVYSPHWINQLRTNKVVYWLCIILQLWIFTWPVIWLLEHRYEVVQSVWYASKTIQDTVHPTRPQKIYARGCDETRQADLWGPVVTQAAWERRQGGCILTEQEVRRMRQVASERRDQLSLGEAVLFNNPVMLGMVRGIGGRGRWGNWSWDFTRGWGADS